MNASNSIQFNTPKIFVGAGIIVIMLLAMGLRYAPPLNAPAPHVARAASLAAGTEGLLKQTAAHLSKMQGGESIGGFPGFDPPDDDEKYKQKIKNKNYSPRDVNDWVKEINNFLRQIIEKNPEMKLEEILMKQGLTTEQTRNFILALKDTELAARGMATKGVEASRALALRELLLKLGVTLW